jgi:hypothetical protein
MIKYISLFVYACAVIALGLLMIFFQNIAFSNLKLTIGVGSIICSILAMITAKTRQPSQVQFAYHELHAFAMFAFGMVVLLLVASFEELNFYLSYLFIFYTFSEVLFCIWLFNLKQKVKYQIVYLRLFLSMMIGIATIVLMSLSAKSESFIMLSYGSIFILLGINVLLYNPVMKSYMINQNANSAMK